MWRPAVAIVLGVALAGAVLAHTVLAQNPPASGPSQPHGHDAITVTRSDMHAFCTGDAWNAAEHPRCPGRTLARSRRS
jgi:hypothetical protein